ncbi:MAG: CocE/NonD family hydrolase [Phycisphaerae bacterium]|nr:CocE/NonD family hydrolase [Phycisphaerae bacterium]
MYRTTSPSRLILTTLIAILVSTNPAPSGQTVMVPMRDGVKLATDVHLPGGKGPWPTILVMTPYNKNGLAAFAGETAKRGYALVAQDFRGRFASEGEDYPVFLHCGWGEHQDGYDTTEWIAAQKWSNGKIGGWGVSAPGIALNMTAPSRPPHLTCCYVAVAFSDMYSQAAYQGGAFRKGLLEDWLTQSKFTAKNLELVRAHPNYDDFWKALDPQRVAAQVNAPTLFYGGWYDIFCAGTINSFVTINTQGGDLARGKCRLIMEPYGHGRSDDLAFPNTSAPQTGDMWNWFDLWLKNDGRGIEQIPAVQYYVMGDPADPNSPGNKWKTDDDWPVPAMMVPVYLHVDNKLRLTPSEELFGSLSYKYDPKDPVSTVGGANLTGTKGPKDQRSVEERPDVLVFNSPVFDRYIEFTGAIKVKLWVSSTAVDTDFTAKLCDVYPDGRSMVVLDGILRASHRSSMETSELLEPGKIYEIEIDLWSTSLVVGPGHRVRIAVSSSNSPRFEPNPNTGRVPGTDDKTEIATNTVYMNANHPSHILLPVANHWPPKTDTESTPK